MARLRATSVDFAAAKAMTAVTKDADMSPFNATAKLFEPRSVGASAHPPRCVWRTRERLRPLRVAAAAHAGVYLWAQQSCVRFFAFAARVAPPPSQHLGPDGAGVC
jgi:hypothetical protein